MSALISLNQITDLNKKTCTQDITAEEVWPEKTSGRRDTRTGAPVCDIFKTYAIIFL